MATQTTQIQCPKCGEKINIEDVLSHQIEEKHKKELISKITELEKDFASKQTTLEQKEKELQAKSLNIEKQIETKANEVLVGREKEIKEKLKSEYEEQIESLSKDNTDATAKLSEMRKTLIENEKLKQKLQSQKQDIELEFEQKLTQRLNDEAESIKKRETERVDLKIKELEKKLKDQTDLAEQMRRKAEQGSMQLQGEAQELALEEVLTALYPFDLIKEVPKGIKGADVIQVIRNRLGNETGVILYESKRTKAFSNDWISKLKSDAVLVNADICVIVTEALPDGIDRVGQIDGVWICGFHDFKGLTMVVRESLLKISEAYASQTNKGEKMQMLYDYLTGNEFRLQLGAIIEGFSELHDSYNQERRAMERIWKQREKQLQKVLLNTNHFIGSIQGIAGSSMPELKQIGEADDILRLDDDIE